MIRVLAVLLVLAQIGPAQVSVRVPLSYYFPDTTIYDPAIPTPEQFFGFQVGVWHLTPDQLHAYVKELDGRSDRMSIIPMGRSHELRPVVLLVVTSPENHQNLEQIRQEHLSLSNADAGAPANTEAMPVVVWLGYSVHGNEASGSNAAALVAYHFVASRSPETLDQLRHAVILLNPSINPDGLQRFSTWVNANRGSAVVTVPSSREHQEPWPGGRGNHYWFDLNRDWMPLVHPESRARLERYYEWRPNVLTDHHEMGTNATFFFQPGIASRNNPLTPPAVGELTARLAQFHANALDKIGSLYYTKESFDDFYVGKGSSYPDITGGIGILFEQASPRGHAQDSPGGTITFPFAIRNHVTSSLSSVLGSVALRTELLRHQRSMATTALSEAGSAPVKAYGVSAEGDPLRSASFVDVLTRHQIDVYRNAKSVKAGTTEVRTGQGYIIPVRQPQYRLLKSLFERRTQFEDSLFYDISAWNLPMAYGLPYGELTAVPSGALGERASTTAVAEASFVPQAASIAYAIPWSAYGAPRVLHRLLAAGIRARIAVQPFEVHTTSGLRWFDRGTAIIPLQRDRAEDLHAMLSQAAKEDGVEAMPITSGLAASGIDLGSANLIPLALPRIALLAGAGASGTDAGEIWHLLDERMKIPVALLDPAIVGRTDLTPFNVLIMAGGSFPTIDSAGKAALQEWTGRGNTLIATEQAAEWALKNQLATGALRKAPPARGDSARSIPYADEEAQRNARGMPGAIVEVALDLTHPLAFGYRSSTMPWFKSTSLVFEPAKGPFSQPVRMPAKPLLSGYVHPDMLKHLSGGGSVVVSSVRTGRSILLADNPAFRGYWYGTNRLLLNAIFFGPLIRQSSLRAGD